MMMMMSVMMMMMILHCYAMYAISASSELLLHKQRQPTEHVLEQWHLVLQEQLDDHRVTYNYDEDDNDR